MQNKLVDKLTSRFFRKVEDAVWDMTTGAVGLKRGDSVFTFSGTSEKDAQVTENLFETFTLPIPAFAQPLPLASCAFGDLVYGDKGPLGWVLKVNARTISIMTPQGFVSTLTPRKVQMFGGEGNTMMVLRSLVQMNGGETGFAGMQQSMLPMLMLMGDKPDSDMLTTMLMLQFMGGQGNAGAGALNPLMMLALSKGKGFFA